jgi:hypothetical protein
MSEPKQEFLRRGQVMDWLEEREISRQQTRKLLEDEVIVGKPLLEWFDEKKKSAKAKAVQGKNGHKKRGREKGDLEKRYRKSQIKEALKL